MMPEESPSSIASGHPAKEWSRFGISDTRFVFVAVEILIASCLLLFGESVALLRISQFSDATDFNFWARYLWPLLAATITCITVLIWRLLRQRHNKNSQEIQLDPQRHSAFFSRMADLLRSAMLPRQVEFRYLPWRIDPNAYVSRIDERFSLTVTRGLIALYWSRPQQAEAILSHEISHMQADDVGFTNAVRKGCSFALVLVLAANGLLLTIYFVRRFALGDPNYGLAVTGAVVLSLTAPIAGFLYYREYLLGREFVHDLRAVQLMSSPQPLKDYLLGIAEQSRQGGLLGSFREFRKHFQAFHPTANQRLRNLDRLDPFRDWSLVAPFFAGAFLALLPIEIGLFCAAIQQEDLQRPLEWIALVISTFLLLRSDFSRLAIYVVLREKAIVRTFRFFVLLLTGSLASVLPFLVLSSVLRGRSFVDIFLYAWRGLVWTAIGYGGASVLLAYPTAVSFLLRQKRPFSHVLRTVMLVFMLATTWLCTLITLSRGKADFSLEHALIVWVTASFLIALLEVCLGGCQCCGARAWNALSLTNTCRSCGCSRIRRTVI